MRHASRSTFVHLRPHGRLKILLGSTLTMTLLAVIGTLPSLSAQWFIAIHQLGPSTQFPQPLAALSFFWPVAAISWIIMFAASRTMLVAVLFPAIPLGAMKLPALFKMFPAFTIVHLLAIALGAWVLFGLWYLPAARVRLASNQTTGIANVEALPYRWLLERDDGRSAPPSPAVATKYYLLGCGSYRVFAVTGVWTAAVFLAMNILTPRSGKPGQSDLLLFMLPFMGFHCATVGFTTARRARLLWLRTGMNRSGLFAIGEQLGLRASLITWGIVASAVTVFLLITDPANARMVLLFVAAQTVVAVGVFYVGLALVRNWSAGDVVLCISSLLLVFVQMIFAHPAGGIPSLQPVITLLIAGVLLLPLRWFAHRRWQVLDWRLIKPVGLAWRRS